MIDQYIKQYGKRLYGLCLSLCGNSYDADDLYQETWLKVCRNIDKYNEAYAFEGWLTGICVNTYRDGWRRRKRSPVTDAFATTEQKDQALENVSGEEKADYSDLHAAIRKLPYKLKVTVILFYFYDMDEARTAEVLRVPPGTVKSRLNRARNQLRKELSYETDL